MFTEAEFRAAATAAFRNAESILVDVNLLYEAERWPRTVSLSIIGREELGKSVIYAVAALERLPGLREVLSGTGREDPSRDHQFKQLAAEIAGNFHYIAEDLLDNSDGWAGPSNDKDWVDWVLCRSADWMHRSGVTEGEKARKSHVRGWFDRMRGHSMGVSGLGKGPEPHDLEAKKWRGLYVDLSEEGLYEPREVSEFDARIARCELATDLTALFRLPVFFEDDELWLELDRTGVA